MDISARNIPAFLVNCGAYHRYLNKALSGEVALPAYEQVITILVSRME